MHTKRISLRPGRGPGPFVAALAAASLIVGACGGSGSSEATSDATMDTPSLVEGQVLYATHCASCHGADLRGTDTGPSHLSIVYEPGHHPDSSFRSAVRNGVQPHHWDFGPMPAVDGLTDDEITEIIRYVRLVQEAEGFEPYPPG